MPPALTNSAYLVASVLFIFGLKGLTHPRRAVRGNLLGALGMLVAIVVTLLDRQVIGLRAIAVALVIGSVIGVVLAIRIQMTAMPQLVALFNGFGGGASVLVAGAAFVMEIGGLLSGVEAGTATQAALNQFTVATVMSGL
ncbi:MAG: NAD(P)(+) transhydrogenase (Re/Si-specific) subunit beta, partial [Phycisphaerae bacterium]|nr:NAD(P)(+) transhydrogenase (Re/Si-specific) subunit beta [Phycisphaerae bacterium]